LQPRQPYLDGGESRTQQLELGRRTLGLCGGRGRRLLLRLARFSIPDQTDNETHEKPERRAGSLEGQRAQQCANDNCKQNSHLDPPLVFASTASRRASPRPSAAALPASQRMVEGLRGDWR